MRPKQLVKVVAKSVFALIDPLFGQFPGPRILIYHQVGVDLGREMEVSIEAFRQQLEWMQSHGEIVDLETALERRGEPGADRLFVLTFDDGFEDVYQNAFPIMKERGIPFTLYLTTNPIETGEPLDPRYPEAKPLTWDQVNEMIGTGLVTVGAHTHTHPDLRSASRDTVAEELKRSNRLIEDRTGINPKHFTYPWGWWTETASGPVRARYITSTIGGGPAPTPGSDYHRIPRTPVQRSDSALVFARRMTSGMRLERGTRTLVDRYLR